MPHKGENDSNLIQVRNPYSGEILATLGISSASAIARKVETAEKAFKAVALRMTPYERYKILSSVAEKIGADRDQLAGLITAESGKPLKDSFVEVDRAQQTFLLSAEEAKNIRGEAIACDITPLRTGKVAMAGRVPLGVLAAITPFNFPLNLVAHKVGPGLAAGNAVILKPASVTPLTALKLREIYLEAGGNDLLFQIVIGPGPAGEALALQKGIRLVSFTGSVAVGQRLASIVGLKRILMELGGNDPLLVMADGNLEEAVKVTVEQALGSNGQRCTAIKRVLVHESIAEAFTEKVVAAVKGLRIGDPSDPETDIGPLITIDAAKEIEKKINTAVAGGADLLVGGNRVGATIHPAVLKNVSPQLDLVMTETFGPVIPITTFKDVDEAVSICNGTVYGLQAGVFTNNMDMVKRLFKELEVGTVIINHGPGFRIEHLPFGGTKMSGIGREGIRYAIEEMTEIKNLVF